MIKKKEYMLHFPYYLSLNLRISAVFFGFHMLVCALFQQDRILYSAVEAVVSGFAAMIVMQADRKHRLLLLLAALLSIGCINVLLHRSDPLMFSGVMIAMSIIQVPVSILVRKKEKESALFTLGFCIFPIVQFLYHRIMLNSMGENCLVIAFIVFSVLSLFRINKTLLMEGNADSSELPIKVSRQNRVYIVSFSIAVLLIANISWVRDRIYDLWGYIKYGLTWIINFIVSLFPQSEGPIGGDTGMGQMMGIGGQEAGDPSWFAVILEKIVTYFSLLVLIILVILGIKKAVQFIPVLLKKLSVMLQRFNDDLSNDYIDEIISTRENNAYKFAGHKVIRRFKKRKLEYSTLNAYVRSVYGRMMDMHPEWNEYSTPRENLHSDLAQIYEKARYSTNTITKEEADSFTELKL